MQHDSRAYLWDVRQAADAILDFVAGVDLKAYAETQVIHSAVERKFQIIGEALNQLSKADPALAARPEHRARSGGASGSWRRHLLEPHPARCSR